MNGLSSSKPLPIKRPHSRINPLTLTNSHPVRKILSISNYLIYSRENYRGEYACFISKAFGFQGDQCYWLCSLSICREGAIVQTFPWLGYNLTNSTWLGKQWITSCWFKHILNWEHQLLNDWYISLEIEHADRMTSWKIWYHLMSVAYQAIVVQCDLTLTDMGVDVAVEVQRDNYIFGQSKWK